MSEFLSNEVVRIILFSLISIVTLFIIAKILGKKQIAELNFIDYVMGISIGSIAADMATDLSDNPFWYYVIAMVIFMLVSLCVSLIESKSPALKRFFMGKPTTLVYNGKIDFTALKKTRLSINDLMSMSRELGYFDISDIAFAILEPSGKLSVLPKTDSSPASIGDLKSPKTKPASLPCYLVIDGKISYSGLNEINKDSKWLFSKLNCKTNADLKLFALVEYNTDTNQLEIHKKTK